MSAIRVQHPCFHLIEILATLTSTSGVRLVIAPENDDCCVENSILPSDDGTRYRWPLVSLKYGGCSGGSERTFQQWIDSAVSGGYGLCFDKWLYIRKGISFKSRLRDIAI